MRLPCPSVGRVRASNPFFSGYTTRSREEGKLPETGGRKATGLVVRNRIARPVGMKSDLHPSAFPIPVPQYLVGIINDAARKYNVDPNLIAAMAFRESRFDANAVSSRGAERIMQLMPKAARALGVRDAFDPQQNIFGGTKYVKTLLDRFHGDITMTLAAYNAGPELVAGVGDAAIKGFYSPHCALFNRYDAVRPE